MTLVVSSFTNLRISYSYISTIKVDVDHVFRLSAANKKYIDRTPSCPEPSVCVRQAGRQAARRLKTLPVPFATCRGWPGGVKQVQI